MVFFRTCAALLLATGVAADARTDAANSDMHAAVGQGDLDRFKAAVAAGADINTRSTSGSQTAIMGATLRGHKSIVEECLELGADLTIAEQDGYTPMHGAGFQGRPEIAALLITKGKMDPQDTHKDGYQPIHRACWGREQRHADMVAVLIKAGVPADVAAGNGKTCAEMTQCPATKEVLRRAAKDEL